MTDQLSPLPPDLHDQVQARFSPQQPEPDTAEAASPASPEAAPPPTDFPNGPAAAFDTNKPVDDMTDAEVVLYYETQLLGRSHDTMSPRDLKILSRNGQIAAAKRSRAESEGENARLMLVRQKIQEQAERQGMAAYLLECLNRSIPLLRRDDPTDEVRITITYAGRSMEIGMTDVQEAWNQKTSAKTNFFTRIVTDMLNLMRDTATQNRHRLNVSDGRNWTNLTNDISWTGVRDQLKATADGQ